MQNAKDKRNLVAAIMGAIVAYIQTEQQTPPVVGVISNPSQKLVSGKLLTKVAIRDKGSS